jgi:hypothetical protein
MIILPSWKDEGDEISYENEGGIIRVRLNQKGRKKGESLLGTFVFYSFCFLLFAITPVFFSYYNFFYYAFFGGFLILCVLFSLWSFIGLKKNERLGSEFIASRHGIVRIFPSGQTVGGSWDDLIDVQLSRQRLYFHDGIMLRMSYGLTMGPSHYTWDKMIAMAPEDSLINIVWKDWCNFADDRRIYTVIRWLLLLALLPSLLMFRYCDDYQALSVLLFVFFRNSLLWLYLYAQICFSFP